jgi:hypothetical protein
MKERKMKRARKAAEETEVHGQHMKIFDAERVGC